jgi:hypothetical protein
VLRQQRHDIYALRFEGLPEPLTNCLRDLAVHGSAAPDA